MSSLQMLDHSQTKVDLNWPNQQGSQLKVQKNPIQLKPKVFDDQMFLHWHDFHSTKGPSINYDIKRRCFMIKGKISKKKQRCIQDFFTCNLSY